MVISYYITALRHLVPQIVHARGVAGLPVGLDHGA